MPESENKKIYWINPDRFDLKPDKSTYLESSRILLENDFQVFILTGYKGKPYLSESASFKIVSFKALQFPGFFRVNLLLKIFFWLKKRLKNNDILIVDAESLIVGVLLRRIKGCFLQLDFRTIPAGRKTLKSFIDETIVWRVLLRFLHRFASGYSFNTESMRQELSEKFGLKTDDYVICHSGVNCQVFKPYKTDKEKKFVFIYHGTVSEEKGLKQVILSLLEINPQMKENIVFRIYGSGLDYKKFIKMVKRLGLDNTVEFKGLLDYDKIAFEISKADAGICPFPDKAIWRTASPLKVFEYLSCAKPVISTPVSSNKRILADLPFVIWAEGFGSKDIAAAIENAYRRRDELNELGKIARDFAMSNCTWERSGNSLARYLKEKTQD
ncbi:MAG: glycosyltransferase [Candidatus Omnitrophica bacterium]|nr:glycosyltransferase [Candidatus Omnitrophota bacterium]